jgi:integrase
MMARRQRGEGSFYFDKTRQTWTARIANPANPAKPFLKRNKNRKELQAWFKRVNAELENGQSPRVGRSEKIAAFLPRWLELTAPTRKPRTTESYRQLIDNHLIKVLGGHTLRGLAPQHVQQLINDFGKDHSPRTTVHLVACLRVALRDAGRWGLVGRNAADRDAVTLPKVHEAEIHPFAPAQAAAFIAAAQGHRFEHLYALLLATGLRLGEAQALKWADVALDGPRPVVRVKATLQRETNSGWSLGEPKSRQSRRTVHLVGSAVAALRAQKDRQRFERRDAEDAYDDHDFVFAQPFGKPITASTAEHDFKKILAAAGLERTHRPHDLRHSCATWLLAAGVSEREIQSILGHSNLTMTRHYEHVLDEMRASAADRFDAWLGQHLLAAASS